MDQVTLGERELDVMTALCTDGPGTVAAAVRAGSARGESPCGALVENTHGRRVV